VGVIGQSDDGCGTTVKGNDSVGSSSNGVVLWLGMWQNGDTVEWWEVVVEDEQNRRYGSTFSYNAKQCQYSMILHRAEVWLRPYLATMVLRHWWEE
jgi:hypothetical protein